MISFLATFCITSVNLPSNASLANWDGCELLRLAEEEMVVTEEVLVVGIWVVDGVDPFVCAGGDGLGDAF